MKNAQFSFFNIYEMLLNFFQEYEHFLKALVYEYLKK